MLSARGFKLRSVVAFPQPMGFEAANNYVLGYRAVGEYVQSLWIFAGDD